MRIIRVSAVAAAATAVLTLAACGGGFIGRWIQRR